MIVINKYPPIQTILHIQILKIKMKCENLNILYNQSIKNLFHSKINFVIFISHRNLKKITDIDNLHQLFNIGTH